MSIYRTGTASLDANGAVVGVGTQWKQPLSLIRVGATVMFLSGSKPVLGSIAEIISDTEMSLIGTGGETAANGVYTILLNDALTVDGLAQDVAETLRYYQSQETSIAEIIEMIDDTNLVDLINQMNQIKSDTQEIQTAAQANETKSKAWASQAENSVVEGGLYSSLHYSRKSAASATASSSSAAASLASQQAAKTSETNSKTSETNAKTSETNAKTSETNAKASENLINQALAGTIKSRGRPSAAGFTDVNAMGNEADVGQWQLDNSANYNLPNVPESQPGILEVAMGGRFARTQIYTGMYGSVFIRSLNSAWVAATPDWMPWRHVGANYTRIDALDVNTLFNSALLYGTGVVNAPDGTGNQYCFIKIEAYGTSPVLQTLTWGTANRAFKRSYANGSWSAWVESINTGNMVSQIVTPYVTNFGLGLSQVPLVADLNTALTTGFYRYASTATNVPLSGQSGTVSVTAYNSTYIAQVATHMGQGATSNPQIFYRAMVNGTWSAWIRMINTGDIGTAAGTVAAGDDSRIDGALQKSGGTMSGGIGMGGNPITGSGQINFATTALARQTLLNTGVSGNGSRILIPVSQTQAFMIQAGSSVLSFNSSGELTLSFPAAYTAVTSFICSNGDANVPGDGYVDSLDSWSLTNSGTNIRNRRITGGGSVIWVTGSYRINWIATGLINI